MNPILQLLEGIFKELEKWKMEDKKKTLNYWIGEKCEMKIYNKRCKQIYFD
jgi:hypothetical protein